MRLATIFLIDFLFFILHVESVYILQGEKKRKENKTDPRIGFETIGWKVFLAEEVNVTVVVKHFLLLRLHLDMFCLEGKRKRKKRKKTQAKCFYCYSMFNILSTTNIYNNEHFQKRKVDIDPQNRV